MRMIIRYQTGLRMEAVLLAANSERMRVAIVSQRDTVELHRVDAGWRTQRGAAIEIEALIPIPGIEVARFCSAVRPWRNAAGPRKPPACALRASC
jgi:hypothetical protein